MNEKEWNRMDWRNVKDELPGYGGAVCVCKEKNGTIWRGMVFHRSRDKSLGKDFFTSHGRAYDYDYFESWMYLTGYKRLIGEK